MCVRPRVIGRAVGSSFVGSAVGVGSTVDRPFLSIILSAADLDELSMPPSFHKSNIGLLACEGSLQLSGSSTFDASVVIVRSRLI